MNNSKYEAYERWIDRMRRYVAIGMGVCFVFFLFTNGSRAAIGPLIGVSVCIFLTVVLVIEYLIRLAFFRPGRNLRWYQFSLSGMLILTACVAAVCAWFKIAGLIGIVPLILAIVISACLLEWGLRKPALPIRPRVIRLTADGFSISHNEEPPIEVKWASVKEIFAYKDDVFAYDIICLGFRVSDAGTYYWVDEEHLGYHELVAELERRFENLDKDWWEKVAYPAFERNQMTIWGEPWTGP